jgi:Rps23 Pro-64 3,4-dihydroxylase Tpa1-like proline 4-hydroxylase
MLELKGRMESIFETTLADRWNIVVHKMLPNQRIGVHNDAPGAESETHRLVAHLNRGWKEQDGGYFVLLDSNNPNENVRIFQPLHNTAIGFALFDKSYHSVSKIEQGVRYTIVYSFWPKKIIK